MAHANSPEAILSYLRERLPRYPFEPELDSAFVEELEADFPHVAILNEIKAFRWYYDNDPIRRVANIRVALRRWLERAPDRAPRPRTTSRRTGQQRRTP